jgi:hypothetical protein
LASPPVTSNSLVEVMTTAEANLLEADIIADSLHPE